MLRPVERSSVTEGIITQLMSLVADGRLKPGDRLPPERELAQILAVGRPSLREAVRSLALICVLETRPGQGTFIGQGLADFFAKPLPWLSIVRQADLVELMEARRSVEIELAGMAARRASPEDVEKMEANLRVMEAHVYEPKTYLEADLALHITIAQAAKNSILLRFMRTIRQSLIRYMEMATSIPSITEAANAQHRAVVDAIKAGDEENACRTMSTHLTDIEQRLLALRQMRHEVLAAKMPLEGGHPQADVEG